MINHSTKTQTTKFHVSTWKHSYTFIFVVIEKKSDTLRHFLNTLLDTSGRCVTAHCLTILSVI